MQESKKLYKQFQLGQKALYAIVLFGFVSLLAIQAYVDYQRDKSMLRDHMLNYLDGITKTLVVQLDADRYDHILAQDEAEVLSNESFKEIRKQFQEIQEANGLQTEVYTLSRLPNKEGLFLVINSGDSLYFKKAYDAPNELLSAYKTGGKLGPYEDENGIWLSAFNPIHNSQGEQLGIVQADIHFNEYLETLQNKVLNDSLQTLIPTLAFIIVILLLMNYLMKRLGRMQLHTLKIKENLQFKNAQLETTQVMLREKQGELTHMNEKLEERVYEQTKKLRIKNEELRDFLYHASHQMKTPVVNIKGILNLVRRDDLNGDEKLYAKHLHKIALRMERLLNQLSNAAVSNPFEKTCVNLKEIVEECVENQNFNDCVRKDIDVEDFELQHHQSALRIIINALVENALYFSYKSKGESALVNIIAKKEENKLKILVRDNGGGINKEQDELTRMFLKGSSLSKGNGLGLYLAQQYCRELNADLKLSNNNIGGLDAIVLLPIEVSDELIEEGSSSSL